jgi:membrane-associated phospholipid phosphatase
MKSTSADARGKPWTHALSLRIRTLWMAKAFGTTVGITGFFILYFWVMRSSGGNAVVVPATRIDDWFGVSELALVPYASLWLYVSLGPALAASMASLRLYIAGSLAISVVGLVTFWVFPTATPVSSVAWSEYPALQFLKAADARGNAFPSLHVAFAAFTAGVIARELRDLGAPAWVRTGNWLWCAAIVYSTLATRQHVLIDVVGGLLLAWAAWVICAMPVVRRVFRASER